MNLYAYVANAPLDFTDPSGMSLEPGAFPEYCRDPTAIPMTPELSGRKGFIAQVVAAEVAFLGLVGRVLDCSIVATPGMVRGAGALVARGVTAKSAANAARLGKQLASEKQVAELVGGGGRVIAGPGSKVPLRDVGRLVSEYGGTAKDWVKVTSSNWKGIETHAYRNLKTGQVLELKTLLPR